MVLTQEEIISCPFVRQPFAECAVRVITGANIPRISRFCMGDYTWCPVYKTQTLHLRPGAGGMPKGLQ